MVNRNLGDLDLALEDYSRAIEIRPDHAQCISYRGDTYSAMGQKQGPCRWITSFL